MPDQYGDVYLECPGPSAFDPTSSKPHPGIVRVRVNSTHKVPICMGTHYSRFDHGAAQAVCRQLGYVKAEAVTKEEGFGKRYFGSSESVGYVYTR